MFGENKSRRGDPMRMEQKMIPMALFILPRRAQITFVLLQEGKRTC